MRSSTGHMEPLESTETRRMRATAEWTVRMVEMRIHVYLLAQGMIDDDLLDLLVREQLMIMSRVDGAMYPAPAEAS